MFALKKIMLFVLGLVLAVCLWLPRDNEAYVPTAATIQNVQTVIIDAGHGGLTNTID